MRVLDLELTIRASDNETELRQSSQRLTRGSSLNRLHGPDTNIKRQIQRLQEVISPTIETQPIKKHKEPAVRIESQIKRKLDDSIPSQNNRADQSGLSDLFTQPVVAVKGYSQTTGNTPKRFTKINDNKDAVVTIGES